MKKEGSREEFSREKVLRGLIRACEKRPVALDVLEELVLSIEKIFVVLEIRKYAQKMLAKWSWTA